MRQVELGEGRGAEALAPGGAERDLLGDGLPTQAEARDGGVANAGVGELFHPAGGVEFEGVEAVDFLGGEHKKPPLVDLNPWGEIPILVDGDVVLRDWMNTRPCPVNSQTSPSPDATNPMRPPPGVLI